MKIFVGKILKAQGIRGEVKASCSLSDSAMLKNVQTLFLKNTPHRVAKIRSDGDFFYVLFDDVHDRNSAEDLRGIDIFCEKYDLQVGDGAYFVEDIVGSNVNLTDGTCVGVVTDVLQNGAADVFVCQNGTREVLFPFLKTLVVSVDIDNKIVLLDAKRFAEVVSDENTEAVTDDEN